MSTSSGPISSPIVAGMLLAATCGWQSRVALSSEAEDSLKDLNVGISHETCLEVGKRAAEVERRLRKEILSECNEGANARRAVALFAAMRFRIYLIQRNQIQYRIMNSELEPDLTLDIRGARWICPRRPLRPGITESQVAKI